MLRGVTIGKRSCLWRLNSVNRRSGADQLLGHLSSHIFPPSIQRTAHMCTESILSRNIYNVSQLLHPGCALPQHQRSYSVLAKAPEDDSGLPSVSADDLLSQQHIKNLARKLQCSVSEMKSLVREYSFLLHLDLDLLESKVTLLLSFDLPVTFIKQNLRIVYQTSGSVLEERLKLIQEADLLHTPHLEIDKLAHLLECSGTKFPRSFKYRCEQRDALEGCPDQLSYLQMRLGCSEQSARSMLHSYPLERHASNVKLKTLLDFFLTEAERNPDFVITYRKLLTFSVGRLRQRWQVMRRAGVESESQMVYVWSMSQKEFEENYKEHLKPPTVSA